MLKKYLHKTIQSETLAFFRLAFGLMMLFSLIRFASYNWIETLYIQPSFHFSYYGFEWVQPLGIFTYVLFLICAIAALCVAIGYQYRIAIITFFLSFTYIELLDKTTYLNHYYFISVISFLLIFLPANASYSIDAIKNKKIQSTHVPQWTVDSLKVIIGIVYFYAGLAKLNSDWLVEAMPLKIWLPNQSNVPLIGNLFHESWLQYSFSYFGAVYDLIIPFLLINKRTRNVAFVLVIIFHLLTRVLFPIGVFPYVMIVSALLFFDASLHKKILHFFFKIFKFDFSSFTSNKFSINQGFSVIEKIKITVVALFLVFQLTFPFRNIFYPDELFWTEEGYRFSWRVMLMEKAGYTQFYVTDAITKEKKHVVNSLFLTPFQEKQMSFQPDFILEYAHFLHDYYKKNGINNPIITVDSFVALNGRLSQRFIDPNIDLAKEYESFQHKNWILPFNDEIKGF